MLSQGRSPATLMYLWGVIFACGYEGHGGHHPITSLPAPTVKASPEGGRRQKLNFIGQMTWGRRRLVYHLSLEGFSKLFIFENLPHG